MPILDPHEETAPLLPPELWEKLRAFISRNPSGAQVTLNCIAGRIASVEYHCRDSVPESKRAPA